MQKMPPVIRLRILEERSLNRYYQVSLNSLIANKSFVSIDKEATDVSTAFQRFYIVPNQLNSNLKIYNSLLKSHEIECITTSMILLFFQVKKRALNNRNAFWNTLSLDNSSFLYKSKLKSSSNSKSRKLMFTFSSSNSQRR